MIRLKVDKGVNSDAIPVDLAPGTWSSTSNVMFRSGFMERAGGIARIFDATSVVPYFVLPYRTATALYWVHVGLAKAFVDTGSARTEITPTAPFTGGGADRWTGGVFQGLMVINNGVEKPHYWNGNTSTDFAVLTGWPANNTCKAFRPFKEYLFAFDVTKSGTRYPYRVMWSQAAEPGALPVTWTAAATNDAGEVDLSETPDIIIDALPLGEQLIIYKSSSMYSCRWIGGQQVFAFARLPGNVGMLGRNCVANTPVGHVVLTTGDIVVHQGNEPRSIANGRVRQTVFDELDNSYAEQASFVATNPSKSEVWICYPTDGNSTCTKAAIWNWSDDTWTFRTLRNVTAGGTGQTPLAVGYTWTTVPYTWTNTPETWGGKTAAQNDQHLVLAHASSQLGLVGHGLQDLGVSVTASAERTGLHLDDPQTIKLLREVWPHVDADDGTVISIYVGAHDKPSQSVTWESAATYTVGTDEKVDVMTSGRHLALKFVSTADKAWRVRSVDLDVTTMGRY